MLKLLLLIIFLSAAPQTKKPANYRDYHKGINKAEELIIQRKFNAALRSLDEVFDSYDFVFVREYKIAAQLALSTADTVKALAYLKKGMRMGWPINEVKKNPECTEIF